jgi:hypothetical protein
LSPRERSISAGTSYGLQLSSTVSQYSTDGKPLADDHIFAILKKALWKGGDTLRKDVIRELTFTPELFAKLQDAVTEHFPDRSSQEYRATQAARDVKNGVMEIVKEATNSQSDVPPDISIPLPMTASVLDLTPLHLPKPVLPLGESYMLIRDEYRRMLEILQERDGGRAGSAFITGQPGIGGSQVNLRSVCADA